MKVTGIAKDTSKILLELEPEWWSPAWLRSNERFVESNDTGSYRDYDADVSVREMLELHEEFRPGATEESVMVKKDVALLDLDGTVADYDGAMRHVWESISPPSQPYLGRESDEGWRERRRWLIQRVPGFWRDLPGG